MGTFNQIFSLDLMQPICIALRLESAPKDPR